MEGLISFLMENHRNTISQKGKTKGAFREHENVVSRPGNFSAPFGTDLSRKIMRVCRKSDMNLIWPPGRQHCALWTQCQQNGTSSVLFIDGGWLRVWGLLAVAGAFHSSMKNGLSVSARTVGHGFSRDKSFRKAWMNRIRRDRFWAPSKGSKVCHEHLTDGDYSQSTVLREFSWKLNISTYEARWSHFFQSSKAT